MEDSYTYTNTPEDSGLAESSSNESNPTMLFTPTTSLFTSRKRKIFEEQPFKPGIKQLSTADSTEFSPWPANPEILSSTMNESITTGVEKCRLDSFASNYYLERSEFENCVDTSSFLKNIKEPSTPEKGSNKRYCTTKLSPRVSPLLKLGSPERNEIMYPSLPNLSRLSDSKRCSPAKKCLFTASSRKDPVVFFSKERNMYDLILKILLYLPDEDLYTCSKVSKTWKKAVLDDDKLKQRLKVFINHKVMNKENNCDSPLFTFCTSGYYDQVKQSTPIEPPSKMYEVTNSLTDGQHLEKCISCNKPVAIVDRNISQCTNWRCGLIRCLKCNSVSVTGPENFIDKCEQSMLLVEKPSPKFPLLGSPKRYQNENGVPSFFLDDSLNTSQTLNSSGYMTDSDLSHTPHRRSISLSKEKADISQVLKTCNAKVMGKQERNWERRNSTVPVISSVRRKVEIMEPSSPPKIKHVAGTKKSKKMLKRLNW